MKRIALIGMMGCGKTSVARMLSERLGCAFRDLDGEIARREKAGIPEMFSQKGEPYFRKAEFRTLSEITGRTRTGEKPSPDILILATGGGTPTFPASAALLKREYLCIYLKLSAESLTDRLLRQGGVSGRPMLAGYDLRERVSQLLGERDGAYLSVAEKTICCEGKTCEEICTEIELLTGLRGNRKFGLIGYPIAHSLSPELFRKFYGGRYAYDLIEDTDFDRAYQLFLKDYAAVNVTAPFKGAALARADRVDPLADIARACNILVKRASGVYAYNSDVMAVRDILKGLDKRHAIPENSAGDTVAGSGWSHTDRILVLGAGGAGRAASVAAAECGADVALWNRSRDKAKAFAAEAAAGFARHGFTGTGSIEVLPDDGLAEAVRSARIIIYTLPCPIELEEEADRETVAQHSGLPHRPEGIVKLLNACPERKVIIEANYRDPALTELSGLHQYIGGKKWLELQAVNGYALMTDDNK